MTRLVRLIQEDPIMARLKFKIGVYKDDLSFMEQRFHRIIMDMQCEHTRS